MSIENIIIWAEQSRGQRQELLQRPAVKAGEDIAATVSGIVERVREAGDSALFEITRELDKASLDSLRVTDAEAAAAEQALNEQQKSAIQTAISNISAFHSAQKSEPISVETTAGVVCERITRAIEAVGLYVPAGSAPLPSTAIMLCVPATLAGCARPVLCTPPRPDGAADPAVVYAARSCGVDEIYKLGGAQAVAAMAYGTESVPKVDKIFGPGNAWVTAAKTQ
ncbi:MAG: histidinol dehydrogenase, partial [Gammaproteobacteria bacterium]